MAQKSWKIEEIFPRFVNAQMAKGVSDKTVLTYNRHFRSLGYHLDMTMTFDELTKEALDSMLVSLRKSGVSPNTISSYARVLEHEHNAVDVLDVPINGAAFRRNTTVLQIADDVISGLGVVFIGVFQKVLQNHIGLQLLVGLLAVFGNNLSLQAFVGFSSYFLVDNFISHERQLLFESSFSNSIAFQKQREKGGFLKCRCVNY